jgi:peptide/nickel transport system substrate-binding protein
MRMRMRRALCVGVCLAVSALSLAACGGSSGGGGGTGGGSTTNTSGAPGTVTPTSVPAPNGTPGGTLKVLVGTAADSLDPQFGYTTQASEADNMVYTPMLDYAFLPGTPGTVLQPALATALPTVSANGLTYTMTMRPGLTFSDGTKVVASDFTYAIERAITLQWGGSSFFSIYIKGAAQYAAKKAKTISGITADDATGKITVTLTQQYGAFDNVLAFPSASPVPSTTPMKVMSNDPPIGIGPYKFGKIVPTQSYVLIKNPSFAGFKIPGIPVGFVDQVDVNVDSNTTTEAQQVLNNTADVFDPGDTIPSSVLPQVLSQAKDRYTKEELASVYYFFLNTKVAPFNNVKARTAVNMAIDRTALARLSSGSLTPGCYFLPPTIVGHINGNCSFGNPSVVPSSATIAKAKALVTAAGLAGTKVTVWSETRAPRQQFCEYYEQLLNKIGFKASLKVIQDAVYFQTIGNQSLNAQTGFADWSQDFPNPSDFYLLLTKAGIQSTNNENFGNVDDPKIETQVSKLDAIPASKLSTAQSGWESVEKYVASQSYMVPFGYETAPKFLSDKVDFASAVFNPVNYLEYNTVELK